MSAEATQYGDTPLSAEEIIRRPTETGTRELPPQEGAVANPLAEEVLGEAMNTFEEAETAEFGGDPTEPSGRPEWADLTHLPRPSFHPQTTPQRRGSKRIYPSQCEVHLFQGYDDRKEYYPNAYPWHSIGKLSVWSDASTMFPSSVGSGVLVAPNVVLTASHVFPWGSNNWKIWFTPGYYDTGSVYGSSVGSWILVGQGYTDPPIGRDMIVLRTQSNLGTYGWMGARTYDDDWEDKAFWTFCGYPCDHSSANRPTWQGGIAVIDDDSDGDGLQLESYADEAKGMSGGPLFGWWDNAPYVIGTHHGWEEEFNFPSTRLQAVAAGGNAMVNLVRWAQQNWPA